MVSVMASTVASAVSAALFRLACLPLRLFAFAYSIVISVPLYFFSVFVISVPLSPFGVFWSFFPFFLFVWLFFVFSVLFVVLLFSSCSGLFLFSSGGSSSSLFVGRRVHLLGVWPLSHSRCLFVHFGPNLQ